MVATQMKRVTYLLTIPRNADPAREAVAQDIAALAEHVQARVLHISPLTPVRPVFPERFFGLWLLPQLHALEQQTDVFHVWHGHPRFFTLLNFLRKPVVYSVTSGLRPHIKPNKAQLFNRLAQVTVSNTRDLDLLTAWNIRNAQVIRPAIDLEKFTALPPLQPSMADPQQPFHLFMASAPWTLYSFAHKGIDSLLQVMQEMPQLHITFLWRDFYYDEMMSRVQAHGLQDRAVVLNARVDVRTHLAHAHAAVLVADDASVVKAYPNSLMEAIACARPVLISQQIPMSDDVAAHGCGVVVPNVAPNTLANAIRELVLNYPRYQQAAASYPVQQFSRQRWLDQSLALYEASVRRSELSGGAGTF
jgi:glycosyltransferase involved in cell wall biosynthesis